MSYWAKKALELQQEEERQKRRENPSPIDAFVWRVMREGYARVICRLTGLKREQVSEADLTAMLEPHLEEMDRDAFAIAEAIRATRNEGASALYERLATSPGVDREMLDQSLEYALRGDEEQG